MNQQIDYFKQELIKRYKYLYTNTVYILAPFLHEESSSEFKDRLKRMVGKNSFYKPYIYLKKLDSEILLLLERFLLDELPMEKLDFFKKLERDKNNKEYLEQVDLGCRLLEKEKQSMTCEILQTKLDFWNLLSSVREFIDNQSGDLENKTLKLDTLDEYFRLNRYSNDGQIWKSGYQLLLSECTNASFCITPSHLNFKPRRSELDVGITNNSFINYFGKDEIHLSEKEKQDVYLSLHVELAWNLEILCSSDETELLRPDHTTDCGKKFKIKENQIFLDSDSQIERYYQICSNCGYIVHIPSELLSKQIRERIKDRCKNDPYLFRRMILRSELIALESIEVGRQKIIQK